MVRREIDFSSLRSCTSCVNDDGGSAAIRKWRSTGRCYVCGPGASLLSQNIAQFPEFYIKNSECSFIVRRVHANTSTSLEIPKQVQEHYIQIL
jgi:hypothetical protein